MHSVTSIKFTTSPSSFAPTLALLMKHFPLARSDEAFPNAQGIDVTGSLSCCIVMQGGMRELYENRIIYKPTGGKLLDWSVATYHEGYHNHYDRGFVTTGIYHWCHCALKLVEQVRHCQLGMWLCLTGLSPYRTHEL